MTAVHCWAALLRTISCSVTPANPCPCSIPSVVPPVELVLKGALGRPLGESQATCWVPSCANQDHRWRGPALQGGPVHFRKKKVWYTAVHRW